MILLNVFRPYPGTVATGLFGRFLGLPRWLRFISDWYGISPRQGAETSIYLATSPEVANTTGEYFRKSKRSPCNPIANDEKLVLDLLLQEKILLVQGSAFNIDDKQHLRVVFLPREDTMADAMGRLANFLEHYRQ